MRRPWEGFVATRRFALSLVDTPWTLMLDADERLDGAARAAIEMIQPGAGTNGYRFHRTTYFCGRPIAGAGWGDERLLRLFRTDSAHLVARPAAGGHAEVHERWEVRGDVGDLSGAVHHDSYPTLSSYREKFARYTALEASGLEPKPLLVVAALARAVLRLPWLYFIRGGWRDGWRGAYVCTASALYPAVVAFKALRPR